MRYLGFRLKALTGESWQVLNRMGTGSGLCFKTTLLAVMCRMVGSRQLWGRVVGQQVIPGQGPVVESSLGVS